MSHVPDWHTTGSRRTVFVDGRFSASNPEYVVGYDEALVPFHAPGTVVKRYGGYSAVLSPRSLNVTVVMISLPSEPSLPVAIARPRISRYVVVIGAPDWNDCSFHTQLLPAEQAVILVWTGCDPAT